MRYHHIGHMLDFAPGLKVGTKIKKGDLLGHCGKTGTGSPHCHYEVMADKPERSYAQYVWGMTREQTAAKYLNPREYLTTLNGVQLPMKWNTLGNDYLTPIQDGAKTGFHPGMDLNWGSGASDLGFEERATTDGTIVYMGLNPNDGNWGNHIWWREESTMSQTYEGQLIQETEKTGAFAYVQKGKKRVITADRAGLAALTVHATSASYRAVSKAEWDAIPSGDNF